MKALVFVLISLTVAIGRADYTGILYQQGSNKQKQLYSFGVKTNEEGGKENIETVYRDPEGTIVVEEKSVVEGNEIQRYEIDHKQLKQHGIVEVKDGKIYFTKTAGDKTSTKEEKKGSTFVMNTNFQKFVRSQWEAISGGQTISFRYGVWDRQETVGFEVFKTGTEKLGDQEVVILKMKPSSFIIAALVKPVIFKWAADGSKLLESNGRVTPKQKDGGTFKDLDAEVVYSYPAPAAEKPAEAAAVPAEKKAAKPAKKKK
jgi:hypothetical protein